MAYIDQELNKQSRIARTAQNASSVADWAVEQQRQANPALAPLNNANVRNEQLAQMNAFNMTTSSQRSGQANQLRNRNYRRMTPDQRAAQADQFAVTNAAISEINPDAGHSISLKNAVGGTLDQQYNIDRQFYSPEARGVMTSARTQAKKEIADLLTGANKQAWKSIDDLEAAVNSLPSVKQYGPMVEDMVQGLIRDNSTPELKAQFQAEDANRDSFSKYFKRLNPTASDEELDAMYNDPEFKQTWEEDINAPKFDAIGKDIKQRMPTPDQQAQQQISTKLKADEAMIDAERQRSARALANDPTLAESYRTDPNTGQLVPKPPAPRTDADMTKDVETINAQLEKQGVNERAYTVPDGKGGTTIERKKLPEQDEIKNLGGVVWKSLSEKERSDKLIEIEQLKSALEQEPNEDGNVQYFDSKGNPIGVSKSALESSLRSIRKVFELKDEQTAMSAEDQSALEWANANPNDPRAAAIKKRLGK
jgi:hypothetical protein